jgi:hypothetical protein
MFALDTQIDKDIPVFIRKLENYVNFLRARATTATDQAVTFGVQLVRPQIPVGVSGDTRRNVASAIRFPGGRTLVEGVVGSNLRSPHVAVLELGRRAPGKMPPPGSLIRWVQLKLGVPADKAPGVAFVVARNIARRGFKTWPRGVRAYENTYKSSLYRARVLGFFGRARELLFMDLEV